MAPALILGCTGLVGSHILSTLRSSPQSQFSSIQILARRSPPACDAPVPVIEFINKDTTTWAPHISSLSPAPSVLFCSLATTRAAAGGFENQYKFDHDLNIELAKAAKEAGTKIYGLDLIWWRQHDFNMKGEIEEHVKELGFEHTIILQPGLIIGNRSESRLAETALRYLAVGLGYLHSSLKDSWALNADPIAKAAISAAVKTEKGEVKDKVWVLGQKDIVRLGAKEWKGLS